MKARGFVLNRDTGEPVSGVNVVARAKRNGTTTSLGLLTTDEAGYVSFSLSGVADSAALEGVSLEVVGQPDSAVTLVGEELQRRTAGVRSEQGRGGGPAGRPRSRGDGRHAGSSSGAGTGCARLGAVARLVRHPADCRARRGGMHDAGAFYPAGTSDSLRPNRASANPAGATSDFPAACHCRGRHAGDGRGPARPGRGE